MKTNPILIHVAIIALAAEVALAAPALAQSDPVATVCKLVLGQDKDFRAVGLEQVRDGFKGTPATRRFAALLPQLGPDGQTALIIALGDRGDAAAIPEILKFTRSDVPAIRAAAIRAVGALGGKEQAVLLVPLLGNPATEQDAMAAILCLHAPGVAESLLAQSKQNPALRAKVFPLMVTLHAAEAVPELMAATEDPNAQVRSAALNAVGQLAGPEQVGDLARLIVKAPDAAARQEVERVLSALSGRNPNPDACSQALSAFMKTQATPEKAVLLAAMGRIGGKGAPKTVLASLTDGEPALREAGLQALCNWPDGTVSAKLAEIAAKGRTEDQRAMALDALIRVAPLPNNRARPDANRSDQERLKMVKKAMELAQEREAEEPHPPAGRRDLHLRHAQVPVAVPRTARVRPGGRRGDRGDRASQGSPPRAPGGIQCRARSGDQDRQESEADQRGHALPGGSNLTASTGNWTCRSIRFLTVEAPRPAMHSGCARRVGDPVLPAPAHFG